VKTNANELLEDKLARTKKKRRKHVLKGIYKELFCNCNHNSTIRKAYQLTIGTAHQNHFLGFFVEELQRENLDFLSTAVQARTTPLQRVEIRYMQDNNLKKLVSWTGKTTKKLPTTTLPTPIHTDYIEISVGEKVYAGRTIDNLTEVSEPSYLVREEKHMLPQRVSKIGKESQQHIQISYLHNNYRKMALTYLSSLGIELPKNSFEKNKLLDLTMKQNYGQILSLFKNQQLVGPKTLHLEENTHYQ
jgi:hypothetical protein